MYTLSVAGPIQTVLPAVAEKFLPLTGWETGRFFYDIPGDNSLKQICSIAI
jgi:hypothetical protein